jgi:hypothetical protein
VSARLSRWDPKVLCYSPCDPNRQQVARHYAAWRRAERLPERFDNDQCVFHTGELFWNGKKLPLIVDHRNGNRFENSPGNLRYLCPNCDAQQATRGGLNHGRVVDKGDGKYTLRDREKGRLDFYVIPKTGGS